MRNGKLKIMLEYFVKKEDIGRTGAYPIKTICKCCGTQIRDMVFEPLGRVLPQDVGKRCVKQNGVWYVENDAQFQKRIQKQKA